MKNYKVLLSLNLSGKELENLRQEIQKDRKNLIKIKYQYGYNVHVNHVTETITVTH